jgi:hypothetical protein
VDEADAVELLVPGEAGWRLAGEAAGRIIGAIGMAPLAPGVVAEPLDDGAGLVGDDGDGAQVVLRDVAIPGTDAPSVDADGYQLAADTGQPVRSSVASVGAAEGCGLTRALPIPESAAAQHATVALLLDDLEDVGVRVHPLHEGVMVDLAEALGEGDLLIGRYGLVAEEVMAWSRKKTTRCSSQAALISLKVSSSSRPR